MAVTIPEELQQFVEHAIASGKYRSWDEVVSEALRLLREREEKLDRLRSDIQLGIDQLGRGEGLVVNDQVAHQKLLDDIEERGAQRLADKRKQR